MKAIDTNAYTDEEKTKSGIKDGAQKIKIDGADLMS